MYHYRESQLGGQHNQAVSFFIGHTSTYLNLMGHKPTTSWLVGYHDTNVHKVKAVGVKNCHEKKRNHIYSFSKVIFFHGVS